MGHLSAEQLEQKLTDARGVVTVGKKYRHYKTRGIYIIEDIVLSEKDEDILVVYANTENGLKWARPLSSFTEKVDGQSRFEMV